MSAAHSPQILSGQVTDRVEQWLGNVAALLSDEASSYGGLYTVIAQSSELMAVILTEFGNANPDRSSEFSKESEEDPCVPTASSLSPALARQLRKLLPEDTYGSYVAFSMQRNSRLYNPDHEAASATALEWLDLVANSLLPVCCSCSSSQTAAVARLLQDCRAACAINSPVSHARMSRQVETPPPPLFTLLSRLLHPLTPVIGSDSDALVPTAGGWPFKHRCSCMASVGAKCGCLHGSCPCAFPLASSCRTVRDSVYVGHRDFAHDFRGARRFVPLRLSVPSGGRQPPFFRPPGPRHRTF